MADPSITHAITLWRPWPWAILHGGKCVENRSWRPPESFVGTRIALHAGKKWDEDGLYTIADTVKRGRQGEPALPGKQMRLEGIVGVARIVGVVRDEADDPIFPRPSLVAGRWGEVTAESVGPWFFGPFGWLLDQVVALPEPIECKGAQGLWRLPLGAAGRVNERVEPVLAEVS